MEEKIKEKIKNLEDWKEEILTDIKNAKNIQSDRVIKWGNELEKLEIRISELKSL
jgi:hypothetical protein